MLPDMREGCAAKAAGCEWGQNCASSRTSCMQGSLEADAHGTLGEFMPASIPASDGAGKDAFL